jgi:ADP-heptose:LPS heptosyltransferase
VTVLILRGLGLGDLVTGAPALRMLRAALPGERLVLATPRWLWPLVEHAALADITVHAHELAPIVSPPRAPELAIDLHGSGPKSRRLLEVTTPQRLLAFVGGPVRWDPEEHDVARWCRLLRDGLPTTVEAPPVADVLGPPPPTPYMGATVVHCGAKSASRRWPEDRFAEVAAALAADGHEVVVTGVGVEAASARAIARRARAACRTAGAPPDVHAVTALPLLGLAGLVGAARLVVSGDTGVSHLAAAYARPSVVLMGPTPPHRWGPPEHPRHQVLFHGDGLGDPHAATPDPALLRISADAVIDAAGRAFGPFVRTREGVDST